MSPNHMPSPQRGEGKVSGDAGEPATPRLAAVIGWPVAHSVSPAMHNAAFRALGLNWRYLALPVDPRDLSAAVAGLRALRFAGFNVTIPHKVAMLPLMDELSEEAVAIGAVNTVVISDGRMAGHNTDAYGFLATLEASGFAPAGRRALVMGAGGAARAVVYALARAGMAVSLWNRTPERAASLVADLAPYLAGRSVVALPRDTALLADALRKADLLVNATSVGMKGGPPGSPLPAGLHLRPGMTVFDLIYSPPLTPLLRQAQAARARPVGGLGMLVRQGVRAFSLWTGIEPSVPVMERAAKRALRRR
jgi:shikimate dehydrogenase